MTQPAGNDAPATGPAGAPPADTDPAAGTPGADVDPADDGIDDTDDDGAADSGDGQDTSGTPDGAADIGLKRARQQAANYRTRAREAENARKALEADHTAATAERDQLKQVLAGLQQVLNPDAPKDEAPDPDKLAKQLAESQAALEQERQGNAEKLRQLSIAAALPKVIDKYKADPDLTEAMLAKAGTVAGLDPAAKTFKASLDAAVKALVEAHPRLILTPAPTRSGTEPTGGAGAASQLTREQLASMSPDDIAAAMKAGRLSSLLGGR